MAAVARGFDMGRKVLPVSIRILSPYSPDSLPWLQGNLHTHTTRSDGVFSPQRTAEAYAALGYDFLMFSDHDVLTEAPDEDAGLVLIPGNEVSAGGPHILHVNASRTVPPDWDRQKVLDAIAGNGDFAIAAHPNWEQDFNHCPQASLEEWQGYAGIEIYNGVVRFLRGSPLATDRWDRLLGRGRRVWGYANDDCHIESNFGLAWNVVQAAVRDRESIVAALRKGRFYASTGVTINAIHVEDLTITIETGNAQVIAAVTDYGYSPVRTEGNTLRFTVPGNTKTTYVRFECWGPGESMAWTQPFFIEE